LAANYAGSTFETNDPGVRVYIGFGVLVGAFAIYAANEGDAIDAFWITIDGSVYDTE
jgi:hypothetical protein